MHIKMKLSYRHYDEGIFKGSHAPGSTLIKALLFRQEGHLELKCSNTV